MWTGAEIGLLAERPTWPAVLRELIAGAPEGATRGELEALLDAGSRVTVLDWARRHRGGDAIEALIRARKIDESDPPLSEAAAKLGALPWRACLATAHADVVARACAAHGRTPTNLVSLEGHAGLSGEPFLLPTSPAADLRRDHDLRELVEEASRTRSVLLLGFDLADPDLQQILALFAKLTRAGKAGKRAGYLFLPKVSAVEAEALRERCNLEVQALEGEGAAGLTALLDQLVAAVMAGGAQPSQAGEHLAALELARMLEPVPPRIDLGADAAYCIDGHEVERVVERLPAGLDSLAAGDLLRLSCVYLVHRNKRGLEMARKTLQQVITRDAAVREQRLARFNLAMVALAEGDEEAARLGLQAAAEQDRNLALVPPRFALEAVRGRVSSRVWFECRDRANDNRLVALEVGVLGRPVSTSERRRFAEQVETLAAVDHLGMVPILGSVSEGRMFGVIMDPIQGVPLSRLLDQTNEETNEGLSLDKAFEIVGPVMEVLSIVHGKGLVHRNLHPRHIWITKDGAKLRGFGFLPLVSWSRPAIIRENLGYGAPELLAGAAPSPASDTYALAALLYRCVTGRRPQGAFEPASALAPGLDSRLDGLLLEAMDADPAKRPDPKTLRTEIATILTTPHKAGKVEPRATASAGVPEPVAVAHSGKVVEPSDPDDLEGWVAVLERKPAHLPAREAVSRIERESRANQRWDRVADALAVRARISQAEGEKIVLLRELALIYESRLGVPGSALDAVLDLIDTVSANAQLPLVEDLLRLGEVTGRWAPVAERLRAVGKRLPKLEDQLRVLGRGATIYLEQVGDVEAAIRVYEDALDLEPENLDLQRAAITAYRKGDKQAELATALLTVAELESGLVRHEALLEAATILGELGEHDGALEAAEHVRAEDGNNERALAACERWARELERWEILAEVLPARAELVRDAAEAGNLRREAAEILREQLDDEAGAVTQYRLPARSARTRGSGQGRGPGRAAAAQDLRRLGRGRQRPRGADRRPERARRSHRRRRSPRRDPGRDRRAPRPRGRRWRAGRRLPRAHRRDLAGGSSPGGRRRRRPDPLLPQRQGPRAPGRSPAASRSQPRPRRLAAHRRLP
ncbi:MAG: protein kinase [Myxococcales bacterium]|nr:protein kinase [Myxococcales bacterium]